MAKPSKDNFQERIKALAFYGTSKNKVNESVNNNATLVEYVRTDDGTAYGIIKENHDYYIKKSNSKKDLDSTDFAYIGGLENKTNYKYNTLAEGQKHLNFVVKSINEAYSLGGVYNKLDESANGTKQSKTESESKPENIESFLSSRIKDGKRNIVENHEKKFKASLQNKVEASTNKKGLMSEEATTAIQRALGIVNEEAMSTKDSEQKDSDDINNQNDIEKGQSAALNQDGEGNQKDADKAMAKGKGEIEKEDQSGSIAVDESISIKDTSKKSVYTEKLDGESLSTKDSKIDPSVYNKPSKAFGDASYGGEKVKSLADSEIVPEDMINNKTGKEKATSPVTDENAKKKADQGLKTPKAPSTEDSEIKDKGLATATDKKEKPTSPVNDGNAKKKANAKVNEGEDLSTEDSEIEQADAVSNKKDTKENAQAPINDTNAKAEAEKRNASGSSGKVTPNDNETSGDEDIVAQEVNENKKGDPFKEKSKNTKDIATDDSDQEDGDRVDNKDKHEKVDSHNSHYDVEMAHKEKKGEELKVKKEKGAIVAEGLEEGMDDVNLEPVKQLIVKLEKDIQTGAAEPETQTHVDYLKKLVQSMDGGQMNEDDLSTTDSEIENSDMLAAEGVNEIEGEEDTDAAAEAMKDLMKDLEIDVAQDDEEEEAAPAPEGGEDVDLDINAGGTPEGGEEAPAPEGGEDVDLDVDVDAEGGEEGEGNEPYRDVKKKIADIADIVNSNEFEDDKIKDFINSYLSEFEPEIAGMEVTDRKDMADEILKAKPDADGVGSEVSGLEKGSDDAIDKQMADLEQGGGEEIDVDVEAQAPVQEDEEMGGTFEQYAESRGYGIDELHECGSDEMANIISGYRNDGGSDAKGVAVYIKDPAVVGELGDYGHSDFGEELEPFIGAVAEEGVSFGKHEPMPDVQEDEMGASDALDAAVDDLDNGELDGSADASDLGKLSKKDKKKAFNKVEKMAEDGIPDVADLDNDGEISGYEEKRHNAIQSNMDEDESGDALTRAIQAAIEIAERDGDKERAERLRQQLPHASVDVAEKKEVGFAKMGEPMGGGMRKPQGSQITYEDIDPNEIPDPDSDFTDNINVDFSKKDSKSMEYDPKSELGRKQDSQDWDKHNDIMYKDSRIDRHDPMGGSDDFERKYAKNVKDQQSGVVHSNSVGTHLPNQYSQMNESENKIRKYVQNKLAEMAGKKKPSINESKSTKLKALDKMIEEQYGLYNKKVKK